MDFWIFILGFVDLRGNESTTSVVLMVPPSLF